MTPWFIATGRFGPNDGERWNKYIEWSGLTQLTELVSLDSMLCPPVLDDIRNDYWPHIVNENFMLDYFTDLDFLKNQVATLENFNLLCVFRNPTCHFEKSPTDAFDFVGYDLVEAQTGISALTNCGLLEDFGRALEVKDRLSSRYPDDPHANCDLWAIYRASAK